MNILSLKLGILLEYQNIKKFLQKAIFQIGLKRFLSSQKLKIVFSDLRGEEIVGTFYEKELQKPNQKELIVGKVIKRRGDELYVKWKGSYNS